jgi:hypothetical protein
MGHVLNMFGMGRPIAAGALWGVCLICLHGPPYGCGRPMGRVLNMFGMGRPMAAAALWGVFLICLAWAALWLRRPYGACA